MTPTTPPPPVPPTAAAVAVRGAELIELTGRGVGELPVVAGLVGGMRVAVGVGVAMTAIVRVAVRAPFPMVAGRRVAVTVASKRTC